MTEDVQPTRPEDELNEAHGPMEPKQEDPPECECDNTHQANDTVCRWCWARGRRHWNDPDVAAED